jgi:hypothetical protein
MSIGRRIPSSEGKRPLFVQTPLFGQTPPVTFNPEYARKVGIDQARKARDEDVSSSSVHHMKSGTYDLAYYPRHSPRNGPLTAAIAWDRPNTVIAVARTGSHSQSSSGTIQAIHSEEEMRINKPKRNREAGAVIRFATHNQRQMLVMCWSTNTIANRLRAKDGRKMDKATQTTGLVSVSSG